MVWKKKDEEERRRMETESSLSFNPETHDYLRSTKMMSETIY